MSEKGKILVIEDHTNTLESICDFLEQKGYEALPASHGKEGLQILSGINVDIILTDLVMPEIDGMEVLKRVKNKYPDIPVILITAYATVENAIAAMKEGAFDYLPKPVDLKRLTTIIEKAFQIQSLSQENIQLKTRLEERFGLDAIVGTSPEIKHIHEIIRQVAPTRATVLIEGDSGTGKELVANAVHHLSDRKNGPFIKINCAALSETLLESELFGHEKGAFTGATDLRKGRFEAANGGSLFLDEISEMNMTTQVKLLRVIQEREFERVGGTTPIKTDVRIMAATNANLLPRIEKGDFRKDLYYRLKVITINLSPLCDHKEDIPLLVNYFLKQIAGENNITLKNVSRSLLNALVNYNWPGNTRQLRNVIENMVIMTKSNTLDKEDLPPEISETTFSHEDCSFPEGMPLDTIERSVIGKTMKRTNGNKTKAAQILGISRRTLIRKIQEYEELKELSGEKDTELEKS